MRQLRVSKGGQISVPAEVRQRWNTSWLLVEDLGDRLVIRPAADDSLAALRGAFSDARNPGSKELRRRARAAQ